MYPTPSRRMVEFATRAELTPLSAQFAGAATALRGSPEPAGAAATARVTGSTPTPCFFKAFLT